jgi:hypothetical protein
MQPTPFRVWAHARGPRPAPLRCGPGAASKRPSSPPTTRWEWWTLWFEFALLLALFITCFLERQFKRGQMVFLAFFTLAALCVMISAHNFITQVALGPINVRDLGQDAVNAAAAGFVLLGVVDFALIVVLGKDFGVHQQGGGGGYEAQANGLHSIQFQTGPPV